MEEESFPRVGGGGKEFKHIKLMMQPAGHEFDMFGLDHSGFVHLVLEQCFWFEENGMRNVGKMRNDGNKHEVRKITS